MKSSFIKLSAVLVLFLFSTNSLKAQDILGSWEGKLSIQGNEIPLTFSTLR